MDHSISKVKDLKAGDLVTHMLYGPEWIGMILSFKEEKENTLNSRNEKALIQIQLGTKYENFFKTKVAAQNRINDNLGYVTTNWLFKIESNNANLRSTRNKT